MLVNDNLRRVSRNQAMLNEIGREAAAGAAVDAYQRVRDVARGVNERINMVDYLARGGNLANLIPINDRR